MMKKLLIFLVVLLCFASCEEDCTCVSTVAIQNQINNLDSSTYAIEERLLELQPGFDSARVVLYYLDKNSITKVFQYFELERQAECMTRESIVLEDIISGLYESTD